VERKTIRLNRGGLHGTLCKAMIHSPLSNLHWKVELNMQKSVRVVVP